MPTPSSEKKITDSWKAYQDFTRTKDDFVSLIRLQGDEIWVGEVCFGSPDHPMVRVSLGRDSARLVAHSIDRAEHLATEVKRTLQTAIEASRQTMEKLKAEGHVNTTDLAQVIARTDSLQQLQADLNSAATPDPIACHPATLARWLEILGQSFSSGDPAVYVKVVVTYVF